MTTTAYDAVIVGAGPNGLSAAVRLASAGCSVLVLEANDTIGGGARSGELTEPGFIHDLCSAIHPLGAGSPYLSTLPLDAHGLEWIHPGVPVAHPFDDGRVAVLERSVDDTAAGLDEDRVAWRKVFGPLSRDWPVLAPDLLRPLGLPRHPFKVLRFGRRGIRSAKGFVRGAFRGRKAAGLFGGIAAHAIVPLERMPTAAVGLMLTTAAHAVGWPLPRGGAQSITEALASLLREHGGAIETGRRVTTLDDVPPSRVVLFDVAPSALADIAEDDLPARYVQKLRAYRHGPGVFKVDWALDGPIPWRNPECATAGTVHLGGRFEEIAATERRVWEAMHVDRPFVLLAQPSLFDDTRAPEGKHTAWAYCHVPQGSTVDMTERIERQVDRFAPGFRDLVLARATRDTAQHEAENVNCIGGDIAGGVADLRQIFFRPMARRDPYATPNPRLFLCSASTPPGAGVHGMCGFHAAESALRRLGRQTDAPTDAGSDDTAAP